MGLTTYLVGDGVDALPGWRWGLPRTWLEMGLMLYLAGDGVDQVPGWRWG